MTDEEALIAAVRATPDDDLPRLVYADWLDERGRHERAAFIRDHCALAALPEWLPSTCATCGATADTEGWVHHGAPCYRPSLAGSPHNRAKWNPDWFAVLERIRTRLGSKRKSSVLTDWAADVIPGRWEHPNGEYWYSLGLYDYDPAVGLASNRIGAAAWSRGFIDELRLPADVWVRHGDAVCAAHPVRRVELTTRPTYAYDAGMKEDSVQPGRCVWWLPDDPRGDIYDVAELHHRTNLEGLLRIRWPSVAEWTLPQSDTPVQALWRGMTGRETVGRPLTVTVNEQPTVFWSAQEAAEHAQRMFENIRPPDDGDGTHERFQQIQDELLRQIAAGLAVPPHLIGPDHAPTDSHTGQTTGE